MNPDHDEDTPGRRRPPFVVALVSTFAALALLGGVAFVWGTWMVDEAAPTLSRIEERGDVARVAEQFTVQVNNYSSDSVDEYKASVGELLSTKFSSEFDQAMEDIVVQVQEARMESRGEVLASGVAALDDDSARVLVVADATVSTVFDERARHFRWEVSLVKVDGEWLVDDFTPVA